MGRDIVTIGAPSGRVEALMKVVGGPPRTCLLRCKSEALESALYIALNTLEENAGTATRWRASRSVRGRRGGSDPAGLTEGTQRAPADTG